MEKREKEEKIKKESEKGDKYGEIERITRKMKEEKKNQISKQRKTKKKEKQYEGKKRKKKLTQKQQQSQWSHPCRSYPLIRRHQILFPDGSQRHFLRQLGRFHPRPQFIQLGVHRQRQDELDEGEARPQMVLIVLDDDGAAKVVADDLAKPLFQIFVRRTRVQISQVDLAKSDGGRIDHVIALVDAVALARAVQTKVHLLRTLAPAVFHVVARLAAFEALNRPRGVAVTVRGTVDLFVPDLATSVTRDARGLKSDLLPGRKGGEKGGREEKKVT